MFVPLNFFKKNTVATQGRYKIEQNYDKAVPAKSNAPGTGFNFRAFLH
jgi:hypothetical protein